MDVKDPEGRFLLVKGTIEGHLYLSFPTYTPNKGQAAFFKHLFESLSPDLEGTVILGGDSNSAFDQGLDRSRPPASQLTRPTKESLKIARLIHAQGMADAWKELNPGKRDFSHFSSPHNLYARINHLLVQSHTIPPINESRIQDTVLSDHSFVSMSLCMGHSRPRPNHWRLNKSLLSDPVRE